MAIDRETLRSLIGDDVRLNAALNTIEPYLPALKRAGKAGITSLLDAVRHQDWSKIDRALYAEMSESERDALSSDVLKAARGAVKKAYQTNRLWQEDLLRLVFGLLLSAV